MVDILLINKKKKILLFLFYARPRPWESIVL